MTGEPLAGARVTQRYVARIHNSPVAPSYHEDTAISDEDGRFELLSHVAPSPRMWLLWTDGPYLDATYPGLGQLQETRDPDTGEWLIKFQLLDPKGSIGRYDNGQATYLGDFDAEGRANGDWTFYREDGSEFARGHYFHGDRTSRWDWLDREGKLVATRGCPYVHNPRMSARVVGINGGGFYLAPPYPRSPCPQDEADSRGAESVGP